MLRRNKTVAFRFTLISFLTAFAGAAIAFATIRQGFDAKSCTLLMVGGVGMAFSLCWPVGSYVLKRKGIVSLSRTLAIVLTVSTVSLSLLYLASFGPATWLLIHRSSSDRQLKAYTLVYSPLAHACPRLLVRYSVQCSGPNGINEIEAFFFVEAIRRNNQREIAPWNGFDLGFE